MKITKKITALTVIALLISAIPQNTTGIVYAGGPAISPLDPTVDPNTPTTSLGSQVTSSTSPYEDSQNTTTNFLSASALSMASSASFSASAPRTIELRPSDYNYNDPANPASIDNVTLTIVQGQATIGVDVGGTFSGSTPPNSPYVIAQLYTSGQSLDQASFDWMQNPGHIDLTMSNVKANINYRMTVEVFWPGVGQQSNRFEYFFRYDASILNAAVNTSQQGQLQLTGFDIDGATTQQNQIYIDLVDENQNMVRAGGWLNFGTDGHVTTSLNFTGLTAGKYRLRGLLDGGISEYIYSDTTYTVTGPTSSPRLLATGNVVINNGAAATNNTAINLKINATDLIGEGIDEMCVSINSLTCNSWAAFNANTVANLPTYQGTNYINVFLRNYKNGKKDDAWFWSSINYVATPPTATVVINGGQTVTNSQSVTLAITPANPSTVKYMSFSVNDLNDPAFSTKEVFNASKTLTIPGGDGAKYINVMLEDEFGQKYKYNYSMITLDQTAPVSSFTINSGVASTTDRNITVNTVPGDAVRMRFAINGFSNYSAWENVSSTKALTLPNYLGTNYVNVEFMDAAGNITLAWKAITLNSTPVAQTTSAKATQTGLTAQSVSYQITGSGFAPNAIVYIQMFTTSGTYAASNSIFADANGNISHSIQYSTTPGTSYNFYVIDAMTDVKLDTKTFTAPTIDPYGIYYTGAGNISASGITQTQARLTWWLANYNTSAHEVLIGYRVAGTSGAYIFVPVVTTEPYPTAGTITGLTANTSYDIVVRIRAKADPTVFQDTTALNLFKTLV